MFRRLAPHAVIIICAMYFVFFFIDRVNASMAFIDNGITKGLLFVLCVLAIGESAVILRDNRRRETARLRRKKDARPASHNSAVPKTARQDAGSD